MERMAIRVDRFWRYVRLPSRCSEALMPRRSSIGGSRTSHVLGASVHSETVCGSVSLV